MFKTDTNVYNDIQKLCIFGPYSLSFCRQKSRKTERVRERERRKEREREKKKERERE